MPLEDLHQLCIQKHKYVEGNEKNPAKVVINQSDVAQKLNDIMSQTIRTTLANTKLQSHTIKDKV